MNVETLKNIVLVLLILSILWLIRTLLKRETENLLRSVLIFILFLGAFIYLQGTQLEKITWAGIKDQFKQTLFPEKPAQYVYYKEEGISGRDRYVRYTFEIPGPKLSLEMDPSGNYFNIKDIHPINRVLEYLGLEKIRAPAPELAAVTGTHRDVNIYRWNDYPRGILIMERGICQDKDRLDSYQCIVSLTILLR